MHSAASTTDTVVVDLIMAHDVLHLFCFRTYITNHLNLSKQTIGDLVANCELLFVLVIFCCQRDIKKSE